MAGDQVDQVKSKVDLVEIISSYIPLKKSGRNFSGLCPFHGEKTPSFMVSPERQVWRCFGCGEGGDVFTFLEKMEGWDFKETLTELAKRAGIKLETTYKREDRGKDKLLEINVLASKFYSHLLDNHPLGEVARKYLLKRGIDKQLWEKFGLGYAPGGWDNTLAFFSKRGFSLADLSTAGIVIARSGSNNQGFYDRFRNRLIFPLRDGRGTVLGFSARIINLGDSDQRPASLAKRGESETRNEPKYINSPETPIFNKGSILFGLDVSRKQIREINSVLLVEGEFDVLSAWKAGVTNVVASKGTALSEKQVVMLSRICENVILCFDTDLAGDAASRRGIELLDMAGLNIKVVRLGKFKDPDEFAQSDAPGFKKAIGEAVNIYDYFIESATGRYDVATALGKKKIGQELLPVIAKISDDIVRAHYISQLSAVLDLDISLIAAAVEKRAGGLYAQEPFDQKAEGASGNNLGLEEYFLTLFVSQEEIISNLVNELDPSDFEGETARRFWKWVHDIMKTSSLAHKSFKKLLLALPKELAGFVDNLYLVNINPVFLEKEIGTLELFKVAGRIKQLSFRRQMASISLEIKIAQKNREEAKVALLLKQFDQLSKIIKEGAVR